jgi:transposase
MMTQTIERVDTIPLIHAMLTNMGVEEVIDNIFVPHGNWTGLSYGRLSSLFVTYVVHSLTHRLSSMESWVKEHKSVIEKTTGWQLTEKDATDDRLARLAEVLGYDMEMSNEFQLQMSQRVISGYQLPTDIARYDTTSFNVWHQPKNSKNGLLELGHSKDHRPDLLQYKQGLAVLDPAGVPILSETIPGNRADDPLYFPAWERMVKIIGRPNFLYVADCKAASLETRAGIDHGKGYYLFPLPMTGDTPKRIQELVLNPPKNLQDIVLEPKSEGEDIRIVGKGFAVNRRMEAHLSKGEIHSFEEQWMVTRSDAHAERQIQSLMTRIDKTISKVSSLKPKANETADSFQERAKKILENANLHNCLQLELNEAITLEKKYVGKGRPGPNRPLKTVEIRKISIQVHRNEAAIEQFKALAGWRIYVTNVPADRMTVNQSTQYYRDEWLVERGFHRFKKGHIPALPLFLRIPERIKGLMLLLTIALQALTLMEFVSRKELARNKETLSGLVPGNPKMKTSRPTAERLLSQFDNLNLLIEENQREVKALLVGGLTQLQKRILSLLRLPESIYDLSFTQTKIKEAS